MKTETLIEVNRLSGLHLVLDPDNVIISSSELAQKVESLNIGMNFGKIPQVVAHQKRLLPVLADVRAGAGKSLYQRSSSGNRLYRWDFKRISGDLVDTGYVHVQRVVIKDRAEMRRDYLRDTAKKQAGIGIWEVDLLKEMIYWDDVTRQIHEVSSDFVPDLGSGIEFYKEGEDRDRITKLFNACVLEGKSFDSDFVIISTTGREIHVNSKGRPEFKNGKCIRVFGTFQDITQHKLIEQELRTSEAHLSSAIDNTLVSFFIVNAKNYRIVRSNKAARKTFGYTSYELQNFDIRTIAPAGRSEFVNKIEAASGRSEFTAILCHKLDTLIEAKVYLSTLCDHSGNPENLLLQIEDITELSANRRHLDRLNANMQKQNERLLNFAHIVSHNLRSHTTNITMLTELLITEKNTNEQQQLIEFISEASASLNSTITDLNQITSLDRDEVHHEVCYLKNAVDKAKISVMAALSLQDFKIVNHISPETKVKGTTAYLDSIFFNLITNAVKYRREIPDSYICFNASSQDGTVVIKVEDNGLGIDMKRHGHKIFGLYKTFHGNDDAQGLGLYMTKGQIDLMDGSISVESQLNQGTTFTIILDEAH
ncbi:MAG: PAS domain-containing sensor histidine kinase [Leeuwenhoekiella sp.]